MRPMMVAANWKMYGSQAMISDWLVALRAQQEHWIHPDLAVVACLPSVYLHGFASHRGDLPVALGAQNLNESEPGAYTGEIGADMLCDVGCRYVLVGHSERRRLFHEQDPQVALKVAQAKRHGLCPILCVGESEPAYRQGRSQPVVLEQIQLVVDVINAADALDGVVIAYEPVWAIGTGHAASADHIAAMHGFIREQVARLQTPALAQSMQLLYGGSLKAHNAAEIFALEHVDGGLIGSAALDAQQFLKVLACTKSFCSSIP